MKGTSRIPLELFKEMIDQLKKAQEDVFVEYTQKLIDEAEKVLHGID